MNTRAVLLYATLVKIGRLSITDIPEECRTAVNIEVNKSKKSEVYETDDKVGIYPVNVKIEITDETEYENYGALTLPKRIIKINPGEIYKISYDEIFSNEICGDDPKPIEVFYKILRNDFLVNFKNTPTVRIDNTPDNELLYSYYGDIDNIQSGVTIISTTVEISSLNYDTMHLTIQVQLK